MYWPLNNVRTWSFSPLTLGPSYTSSWHQSCNKTKKNIGSSFILFLKTITTLQSIMNAKLSQQRFWHCYENGLINTIQTIPHIIYMSCKLASHYGWLRLIKGLSESRGEYFTFELWVAVLGMSLWMILNEIISSFRISNYIGCLFCPPYFCPSNHLVLLASS